MALTKGFLYFFSICKTFWFFVSFSQDWTKWGIHPHGGTFSFNSSSNISFPKRWTYSLVFVVKLVWLKCYVLESYRFNFCIFYNLICCYVQKCWRRRFLLQFPVLPLGDCLFLSGNLDAKGFFFALPVSLIISKVSFWVLVLSSTRFRNWWSKSSVQFVDNSGV